MTESEGRALFCSELWLADQIIPRLKETVRFVSDLKKWYVWDGDLWVEQDTIQDPFLRLLHECIDLNRRNIPKRPRSKMHRRMLVQLKEAQQIFETDRGMSSIFRIVSRSDGISAKVDIFDKRPWLFCCGNRTVNLVTGENYLSKQEDYLTIQTITSYRPSQTCPQFDRFLRTVFPNKEIRHFFWKALAYTLSGSTDYNCLFLLHGLPGSGKSTLLKTLRTVLGGYAKSSAAITFSDRGGEHTSDLARMRAARMVILDEPPRGLNEQLIKKLTSGDAVAARALYANDIQFVPRFKIWIDADVMPKFKSAGGGLWRRLRILKFMHVFTDGGRERPGFDRILSQEAMGILAKAVKHVPFLVRESELGSVELKASALKPPRVMMDSIEDERNLVNPAADWIEECCEIGKKKNASLKELHMSYQAFADDYEHPISERGLGQILKELGYESARIKGQRRWVGIGVKIVSPRAIQKRLRREVSE